MQEYKPTTIQLRSFARKTLTYHDEKHMQTIVVNLPLREMPNMPRKSFHQQVHLTFKRTNTQVGRKNQTSQESELCVMSRRGKNILNI
jgi:hypothetical protein